MNDIRVVLSQVKAAGAVGFGVPLILAGVQEREVPYTVCSDMDGVKALFGEDTPVYKAAQRVWMQHDAPAAIAVCASAKKITEALDGIFENDWRQLVAVSLGQSRETPEGTLAESTPLEIAEYIEGRGDKLFFLSVSDTQGFQPMKTLTRTVAFYHPTDTEHPVCALVGASAGKRVGSFTYKNLILRGVEPLKLSDAAVAAVHDAGAVTVLKKAGDIVSSEGRTTGGEYVDLIDTRDYIIKDLVYREQKQLNAADKIPYDNNGIAQLEAVAVTVLQEAYNAGMIAVDDGGLPDFSVTFQKRSETSPGDRAERRYLGGRFRFGLAGAVHTAEIRGEIIV